MSYISEVANLLNFRFQGDHLLNPNDYALIAEWEKQKIPLFVVLDSINEVFDNFEGKKNKNNFSAEYFHYKVKRNFASWLQNQNHNKN